MAVLSYTLHLPDGRKLVVEPKDIGRQDYFLEGRKLTKGEAESVFNKQPEHWQRGRTLNDVLKGWGLK